MLSRAGLLLDQTPYSKMLDAQRLLAFNFFDPIILARGRLDPQAQT
jgi:hypothetical protein